MKGRKPYEINSSYVDLSVLSCFNDREYCSGGAYAKSNTQNRTAVKRRFNIRLVPTRIDVFILENFAPTEGVGETSPFTL